MIEKNITKQAVDFSPRFDRFLYIKHVTFQAYSLLIFRLVTNKLSINEQSCFGTKRKDNWGDNQMKKIIKIVDLLNFRSFVQRINSALGIQCAKF